MSSPAAAQHHCEIRYNSDWDCNNMQKQKQRKLLLVHYGQKYVDDLVSSQYFRQLALFSQQQFWHEIKEQAGFSDNNK